MQGGSVVTVDELLALGFEAAWHLSKAPTVLGWSLLTGGACALSWLAGRAAR